MHNWQAEGKTRMKAQLARANMLLTDTTMRTQTLLLARMRANLLRTRSTA